MKEDVDNVIPEVLAYRDRDRYRMWCVYCDSFHFHRALGLQAARCPAYTDYTRTATSSLREDAGTRRKRSGTLTVAFNP
jgi:hypothetical protein